jgi:hypothetical protein
MQEGRKMAGAVHTALLHDQTINENLDYKASKDIWKLYA